MSLLCPSRAAEKVAWRDCFGDYTRWKLNGGSTVGGTAVLSGGLFLSASGDYVDYTISSALLGQVKSIRIEFTPDWSWDDNTLHDLVVTGAPVCGVYKRADNKIRVDWDGSTIYDVYLDLSGIWRTNHKNVIVVALETGSIQVYINGQSHGSSASAFAMATGPTSLSVSSATNTATGVVHSVSFYKRKWALLDASADWYPGGLFGYTNRALVRLDCDSATNRRTLYQTLNKAKNSSYYRLGDGAGNAAPSYLAPGFRGDGSTKYIYSPASSIAGLIGITIICSVKLATSTSGEDYICTYLKAGGANGMDITQNALTITSRLATTTASRTLTWTAPGYGKFTFTRTYNGTDCSLYVGRRSVDSGALDVGAGIQHDSGEGTLLAANTSTGFWGGDLYKFHIYPFCLSPIQLDDAWNMAGVL